MKIEAFKNGEEEKEKIEMSMWNCILPLFIFISSDGDPRFTYRAVFIDLNPCCLWIFLLAATSNESWTKKVIKELLTYESIFTLLFYADRMFTCSLNNGDRETPRGRTNFPICL